jgi:hypothetical protein
MMKCGDTKAYVVLLWFDGETFNIRYESGVPVWADTFSFGARFELVNVIP